MREPEVEIGDGTVIAPWDKMEAIMAPVFEAK
jgi:hypothetical protein